MDTLTTREPEATVRVTAMVEPSIAERLVAQAFRNDRSIAAEIRVALRAYLRTERDR